MSSGRAFAVRTACTFSGVPEREDDEEGREGRVMVERQRKVEEGGRGDRGGGGREEGGETEASHYWPMYQHSVLLL